MITCDNFTNWIFITSELLLSTTYTFLLLYEIVKLVGNTLKLAIYRESEGIHQDGVNLSPWTRYNANDSLRFVFVFAFYYSYKIQIFFKERTNPTLSSSHIIQKSFMKSNSPKQIVWHQFLIEISTEIGYGFQQFISHFWVVEQTL